MVNNQIHMKRNAILSAILTLVLFNLVCGNCYAQSNLQEAKKAIAASNAIYFQSFAKNDPAVFVNRYAEDCLIMLPNAPAMKGHKGALEFFRIAYNDIGLRNGKFSTTEVYGLGNDYVVEEGFWQSFDKNNNLFDNGKFLVLWKKTAKGWKMFRDSFSSNRKTQ
jgi:ketosteroid isomerase-like protein